MLKKTITYVDYNGVERTEDFYFNLTKAEVVEMESSYNGLIDAFNRIIKAEKTSDLVEIFKDLIKRSYGEKSPDGRRFVKSQEIFETFSQTEAYSQLFMKLATDDKAASEFMGGLLAAVEKRAEMPTLLPA